MSQFSGLRLVRTSVEGGSILIDKVILLRNGQEVMSRSFPYGPYPGVSPSWRSP